MADLSASIARALQDPAIASALAKMAGEMLRARDQGEDLAWGHPQDGEPELDDMPLPSEAVATLGALHAVAYVAEKGSDGVSVYEHVFSTPRPWLVVTAHKDLAILRGHSRYTVKTHGIID